MNQEKHESFCKPSYRDDENHNIVRPLEKVFANKAGYFDALREMEILAFNGKMRFCEE